MPNIFNSVKQVRPKNNVFDLTHDIKLSANMGTLIPVMCTEAVPGDKFNIGAESLLRFSPLVAPVMHRYHVTFHYYFVPNRLTWSKWEQFITNTADEQTGLVPSFPTIEFTNANYTELADYFGIPTPSAGTNTETVSALPFAAYQLIYNEYYRDQNLIDKLDVNLVDGDNSQTLFTTLRRRAWEHDYFTSALPFAQKGAAVDIPLGEVVLKEDWQSDTPSSLPHWETNSGAESVSGDMQNYSPGGIPATTSSTAGGFALAYNPDGSLVTEGTTINDLRRAFRLQEWLEKAARGGTRYIEFIRSMFGVSSSDKRLQRPEYITGTKSPVVISEIVNTTGTTDLPQGNMAGHAISVTNSNNGSYYCEEHGYIIGIMSVMPQTAYQQGIPKHFLKTTDAFQYYFPDFANIGEQEVLNKEVYAFQGATGNDTFGYVPRYAEYKFEQNRVAGDFRDTLDFWHSGRIFSAPPALNQAFIECTPDDRIFAVTDPTEQKLYAHVLNKVRAVRPMPKYGTPTY